MSSLQRYLLNLNIFERSSDSDQLEDAQRCRSNIIATRVFLALLVLVLIGIGVVLSLIDQTTTITLKYPTREQFEVLPLYAQCPCSRISLSYGKFASLRPSFHQVCTSDFVSDRWFYTISSGFNSTYFVCRDFRGYGSAQFQALASFCRLSKASIEQNIAVFYLNTLLSPTALSESVLRSQTQASIDQFRSTAPNTFKTQLRLVNEMTTNNRLMSGLQTNVFNNYYFYSSAISVAAVSVNYLQADGSICYCYVGLCSKINSGIYYVFDPWDPIVYSDVRWYVPGISAGCLPVNSILLSTLECFYDQTCLNKLISYFPTRETFTAMTPVTESQYSLKSTVQSMVDYLMVEDWMINISYDKYYSQCAPSSCTYSKVARHSWMFVLTKLISLLAGLTLLLTLTIPHSVRFIQQLRHRTARPRTPLCVRLRRWQALIQKAIVELNMFTHHPSTDRQIRHQRYATQLYILLMFISVGILTSYTLLEVTVQSKTILRPTQSDYIQLQQAYSYSLSCPCTSISISYSTLVTIEPHYHQLCSSDFVSQQWIEFLQYKNRSAPALYYLDYRSIAAIQFRSLAMLCEKSQQTISDALRVFLQTQFVSSQVISQPSFELQLNSFISDWKSTTIDTFKRTIRLIRATTQGNQLCNGAYNAYVYFDYHSRKITLKPKIFSDCTCGLSALCRVNVGIYEIDQITSTWTRLYSVPNFFIGCHPIEALFASTLECFYNLSCILKIDSYSTSPHSYHFSVLDASLSGANETIEQLADRMMVDRWSSDVSFASYYNTCAPLSCTYQIQSYNSLFSSLTTIAGVFGGLSLTFKLIFLIGLQVIDNIINTGFSRLTMLHFCKRLFTCDTQQQMTRRLHFLLVIITLYVLYIFSAFSSHLTTITIGKPSLSVYENLVAQYHDSVQCPCSRISIKYESFFNIAPRFHQVCMSDFVSDRWIAYLYDLNIPVYVDSTQTFSHSASAQFQLLASFCRLSEETVNNALFQLGASDFINTQLLPSPSLKDRLQTTINEFQSTMPNLFVNTLSLIRETTGANMLITVLSTSWTATTPPNLTVTWSSHNIPLDYQGCSCALSSKCVSPSQGMLSGCYPLEAILQTTLECLHKQQCIDSTTNLETMNNVSLGASRFPIDTPIESIVNELMVEEFSSNISYEVYFEQCAPVSCTYSYVNNKNIIEGITTLIGLYGGLLIICRLFALFIVKQFLCVTQRVTPITD